MSKFEGKVVIVTGASSGIGRTAAIEFAKEGAQVAVVARRESQGVETVDFINSFGGESIFLQADVSKSTDVQKMVANTIASFGRLDFAFNNAGTAEPISSTVDLTEEEFDRVFDLNARGTWLCMKYQIPEMLKHGGGSIVNMASVWSVLGTSMGVPAYVASKHAVVGLTKATAMEFAAKGIRVNCISPAWVPTEGNSPVLDNPELREPIVAQHPLGRLGTTLDVANAVKWMCSDEASWFTSQNMVLDGGYCTQ